jgi:polar amino acid transport system permease protein
VAFVVALAWGLVIAGARMSRLRPVRVAAGIYIDIFRSTPVFIQLIWFYYALPILTGLRLDGVTTATIGLGLVHAAFYAEIYRTGLLAVPRGQREAALSQGMTERQALLRIQLPQAVRMVIPPMTSGAVSLVKDSSIASTLAVNELMFQAGTLNGLIQQPLEVLSIVALIYILLTYPLTLLGNWIDDRWRLTGDRRQSRWVRRIVTPGAVGRVDGAA